MFSFIAPENRDVSPLGLDLLGYATRKLESTDVETLAAQVPSDAAHLNRLHVGHLGHVGGFGLFIRLQFKQK